MTTQNEAAERLREQMRTDNYGEGDSDLDEALAAERAAGVAEGTRATVERYEPVLKLIRKAHKAKDWKRRIEAFDDAANRLAILDEGASSADSGAAQ